MARRHVLIGSGPASIAAAESIRAIDAGADITIIGAESAGYYSRPGLAYYLAKEVPEKGLFPFSATDFDALGVRLEHDRAVGIDRAAHQVLLERSGARPYDRLLIATGSLAIPVDVPGFELDGVVKLDDMDDARGLIARGSRARAAVVVGGGITALEIVEGLRSRKVHVHYLVRKERYWSNVLSEAESRIVADGLAEQGVNVHYFTELARIVGENGRVVGVETRAGERIPCDIVAVAIGVLPQKGLAERAGLACGRGVLVDEFLRSSDGDIFAAGDVAEVRDPFTGRPTIEVLWNSARDKGRIAGTNMAAEPTQRYRPPAPLNVTRLAGWKTTIMGTVGSGEDSDVKGISRGDSETWSQAGDAAVVERRSPDGSIRLVLGERTIAGAVVMGEQALSFPLQELIVEGADVTPMMAGLREPSADISALVQRFYEQWRPSRV